MDNFEKHIRENAGAFDEHTVDKAKLWANISAELEKDTPKVIPLWKRPMFRIAASVTLIMGMATIFGLAYFNTNTAQEQYVSKELLEIDMHYQDLVAYQVELVRKNRYLSDTDKTEFLSFMDELDAEYEVLRKELHNNLDNEQVLAAIVSNYKTRIELIENLLHQINESKKTNHEYGYTL